MFELLAFSSFKIHLLWYDDLIFLYEKKGESRQNWSLSAWWPLDFRNYIIMLCHFFKKKDCKGTHVTQQSGTEHVFQTKTIPLSSLNSPMVISNSSHLFCKRDQLERCNYHYSSTLPVLPSYLLQFLPHRHVGR